MSTRARASRHDEEGKQEDVRQTGISGSLGCTEIANGGINEARQVAEKTRSNHLDKLWTLLSNSVTRS